MLEIDAFLYFAKFLQHASVNVQPAVRCGISSHASNLHYQSPKDIITVCRIASIPDSALVLSRSPTTLHQESRCIALGRIDDLTGYKGELTLIPSPGAKDFKVKVRDSASRCNFCVDSEAVAALIKYFVMQPEHLGAVWKTYRRESMGKHTESRKLVFPPFEHHEFECQNPFWWDR